MSEYDGARLKVKVRCEYEVRCVSMMVPGLK